MSTRFGALPTHTHVKRRLYKGPGSYAGSDMLIGCALRVGVKSPSVILRREGSRALQTAIDQAAGVIT